MLYNITEKTECWISYSKSHLHRRKRELWRRTKKKRNIWYKTLDMRKNEIQRTTTTTTTIEQKIKKKRWDKNEKIQWVQILIDIWIDEFEMLSHTNTFAIWKTTIENNKSNHKWEVKHSKEKYMDGSMDDIL